MMLKNNTSGGGGGGGIVEGGKILRSTGRKDRHSKVLTAKGPRDRRVRLSAHTAIKFYDLQDRLGYDRPSKAVDWLIKKAKTAIDKLTELPTTWNPIDSEAVGGGESNEMTILGHHSEFPSGYGLQLNEHQLGETPRADSSFQLNHQLGTQSIPDPMKSFFPMTSPMNFHTTQDLCLSLHSSTDQNQSLNQGSGPATFGATLLEPPWDGGGENREGYMFNPHQLVCQSSMGSEREHLQSSCSSAPVHAWINHHPVQFASQSLLQFQIQQQIHSSNEPSSTSPNSHQGLIS
ncbi:hypothetical protein Vadar_000703 [Vaccinium darrowii]|uniref:Uncharacterized protein n=1 Tax=Vaccinium darrowii TaxID=229202 RepID=A0ACB7Z0M0_9ERIC|nr:hypothetical protein Vadar_000703 [Vaccinium darrowii]